jgi:CRP-like cAMP-binding protein
MIVQDTYLFKGVDRKVMDEIASISLEENYERNTVLFRKGENAGNLYILKEGKVELVIKDGGSVVYILTEPGEVFGWSSMVESGEYSATAVSLTDMKVWRIEREKLEKIFSLHPKDGLIVLKRLAGIIMKRLAYAYKELLSVGVKESAPEYG